MLLANKIKTFVILIAMLNIFAFVQPASAITVYTAHVKFVGYNFTFDNNCGDGVGNACEIELKVKRTTSTSTCTGRSWIDGAHETTYTSSSYFGGFYELTWANSGSAPCLTFDVIFSEDTAGSATSEQTFTISGSGSHNTEDLDLILGSANGYLRIEHWLVIEDLPFGK